MRSTFMEWRNLLFPLLLLAVAGGVQGLDCFPDRLSCSGTRLVLPEPLGQTAAIRTCCIDNDGLSWLATSGDEFCNLCIVIQWLNGTSFEGPEQTASYQFAIGYVKGTTDVNAGDRTYSIVANPISPTGPGDFQVTPSTVTITTTTPAIVQVTFTRDGVALEPNETVRLILDPTIDPIVGEILLDTTDLTINDVDAVSLQFTQPEYTGSEESGSVQVAATIGGQSIQTPLVVQVVPLNLSEVEPSLSPTFDPLQPNTATSFPEELRDFNITPITITFQPDNSETMTATVGIVDDSLDEPVEVFAVRLDPQMVNGISTPDTVMVTRNVSLCRIEDNDFLMIEFDPTSYTVSESSGFVNFSIVKQGLTSRTVGITLSTSDGTAVAGEDYVGTTQTVSFPPEVSSVTVMLPIINDNRVEGVEQFTASLSLVSGQDGVMLGADTATIEITDDDSVVIGFENETYPAEEGQGSVAVCARVMSGGLGRDVEVTLVTADESAVAGEDFQQLSVDLTFGEGSERRCVQIGLVNDTVFEGPEQFMTQLSTVEVVVTLIPDTARILIQDDDVVRVEFDPTTYTVSESGPFVNITVVKRGLSTQAVSVEFTTADGSAIAGEDYTTTVIPTVTFEPTETSLIVMVPILIDNTVEGMEQFTAMLSVVAGEDGVVLGAATASVEITDDDSVIIEFSPAIYTVPEGENRALRIVKIGESAVTVSVLISTVDGTAMAPGDYTSISALSVTFAPEQTEQPVLLSTTADSTVEGRETLSAVLSDPSEGVTIRQETANITITEETLVVVEFEPTTYTVPETDDVIFRILKRTTTTEDVTVLFSTSPGSAEGPGDFDPRTNLLVTIPADLMEVTVEVMVTDDDIVEDVESFSAVLSLPASETLVEIGPDSQAVAEIIDNDFVTVEFDPTNYTVSESGPFANITVVKRGQAALAVSVTFTTADDTAIAGEDYVTISQMVTFTPAVTSQVVMVPILNDNIFERVEQFTARLSNTAGQSGVVLGADIATVEITDDDPITPPPIEPTGQVNDTAVGDPLMTVPLRVDPTQLGLEADRRVSLCYEVHGQSDQNFNFVSDLCVSVNAHYTVVHPSVDINVIDRIGVRAVDGDNQCHNIEADVDGCRAFVDGVESTSPYRMARISVRRFPNRIRIAVPNCEDQDLVMWVFCQTGSFGAFRSPMIRFVIARGFNLNESSHGIIGQFWNIPISVERYLGPAFENQAAYIITVTHPDAPGPRRFVGPLVSWTWEKRYEPCLYVGSRQAGSINEVENPNDPVIEGQYTDYIVESMFGTEYDFSHFDISRCV